MAKIVSTIRWRAGRVRRTLVTLLRQARGTSDLQYWAELDNHADLWEKRTLKLASLVAEGDRVIEFGAGRRQLENLLDSSCHYTPSDIVDRGPGTLVIDLNARPLPELHGSFDLAIFGGVLEYIHQVPEVLEWLANSSVTRVIASYEVSGTESSRERVNRAGSGWVNSYSAETLRDVFESSGYPVASEDHWDWGAGDQLILIAENHENAKTA